MGFLRKLTGGTDTQLLATGILGRGLILGVQASGTTVQMGGGLVERKCTFTLEVTLDNTPPYQAVCSQRISEIYLPQFQPGSTLVAVRVDPANPANVAIDFNSPVPSVRMAAGSGQATAADILANGRPVRAVIVASQPLGMKNPNGVDMYAFTLTVMAEGMTPYQIQVGNPTPPEAIPLLFPGSHVPARLGNGPNEVAIDWHGALTEATGAVAAPAAPMAAPPA